MASNLEGIVLDYPCRLSREQARSILQQYSELYPEIYRQWETIERSPQDYLDDGLKEIAEHGQDFLRQKFASSSNMAIITAWATMRAEVIYNVWGRHPHED